MFGKWHGARDLIVEQIRRRNVAVYRDHPDPTPAPSRAPPKPNAPSVATSKRFRTMSVPLFMTKPLGAISAEGEGIDEVGGERLNCLLYLRKWISLQREWGQNSNDILAPETEQSGRKVVTFRLTPPVDENWLSPVKSRVEGKATIESPGEDRGADQEDLAGREGDSSGFEMRASRTAGPLKGHIPATCSRADGLTGTDLPKYFRI